MNYSFIFVCQQGELEIKALLLAASLKRFLLCKYELVAALPRPEAQWGQPDSATLYALDQLGVHIAYIDNPIDPNYPIGNKLACLNIQTAADKLVFLDSDIICLRGFHHSQRFEQPINAKPADLRSFGSTPGEWESVYAALNLSVPPCPVLATVSGVSMSPYFNAGLVAVRRDAGFGDAWITCARSIDADPGIANKRPWLDQIALPAAATQLGLTVDSLDERYNYPAHLKPLDAQNLPIFCHYHWPSVLRREPLANALVAELADQVPAMRQAMESDANWRVLLKPYSLSRTGFWQRQRSPVAMMRKAAHGPDLFITGIARSGTSYLCSLLNKVHDNVVVNEPTEIFEPLSSAALPWGVATFYRDLRRDILDGTPIQNKLHNGEFIEDTAVIDVVARYSPDVSRPDFLLATKNTLSYLARLPQIRRVMPNAKIVVCVRHPFDTIASWKSSFAHLASADVNSFPVGHPHDPHLTHAARLRLEDIAQTQNLALRRALLWRHLAELILDNLDRVLLIRYEDLMTNPRHCLAQILQASDLRLKLNAGAVLKPSTARNKRENLDTEDLDAINNVCGQTAALLGYETI